MRRLGFGQMRKEQPKGAARPHAKTKTMNDKDEALQLLLKDLAAIFPEKESNPKILKTLTGDTGIRLGDSLIADGTGGTTYIEMYRHNVAAIVKALSQHP